MLMNQGIATSSWTASETQAPPRLASVPDAIGRMERSVEGLAHHVGELTARLDAAGVLRASAPTGSDQRGGGVTPSPGCPLADTISGQQARVSRMVEHVAELIQRLEV